MSSIFNKNSLSGVSGSNQVSSQGSNRDYFKIKSELSKNALGYLADRLPENNAVQIAKLDPNGNFEITFKAAIDAPVMRNQTPIPGAYLKIDKVVTGRLGNRSISFTSGVSGSGMGISAEVNSLEAKENGDITMKATQSTFRFRVEDSFNPNEEKKLFGGVIRVHPQELGVAYPKNSTLEMVSMPASPRPSPSPTPEPIHEAPAALKSPLCRAPSLSEGHNRAFTTF